MIDESDDNNLFAKKLLETVPLVMRTVAAEMRHHERVRVTSHFHVLWILQHVSMSLSELAEKHAVTLPTMSNSITSLEEQGWVTRVRSKEDRRKVLIEITPAGLEVLSQVGRHMQANVAEITASLSKAEREKASEALDIIRGVFLKATNFGENCEKFNRQSQQPSVDQ
jgi:DNA-binding MarR family transcriptional regulator